jgi:tetratricopeptide (TPR) repeat protein
VEAPITRTCDLAAALALFALAAPAGAVVNETTALDAYVRARAAETSAPLPDAARAYSAALTLAPANDVLAARAFRTGLWAGDEALATRAATLVDKAGKLNAEGRLLLVAEAVKARRWPAATAQIDRIAADDIFGFMAPVLRAWVAEGSGKGDPLALLASGADSRSPLAAYAPEQRALLLIARGDKADALAAIQPLFSREDARSERLRILLAGLLDSKGWRSDALELLQGDGEAVAAARARLAAGRRLGPDSPAASRGVADFLLRLSTDLAAQDVPDLALSFARIATFLQPADSEGWLTAADLLAAKGQHETALAALARIAPDDPYARRATDRRFAFLTASGREEVALAEARAAAQKAPSVESWTRVGDLLIQAKRFDAAADAFARALAFTGGEDPANPKWVLWLLRGSALTQAGRWPEAKAALQQAYTLAPQQPMVLNFLGYSQLERRENMAEATRLIEEASKRQPDDAAITDSLGWAYYVRGDVPKAIGLLERAARGQPADPAINEHLGDAYFTAGRHLDARYAWRAALVYADSKAAERLRAKIDGGLTPELAAP